MPGNPSSPGKPLHPPEWVFRWRPDKSPLFPKIVAVTLVGAAFLVLVTTVRIQVKVPEKSTPRGASVIYLGTDAESRSLALRAREGGPFPSRFEPTQWPTLAEIERSVMDSARFQPPPYDPVMADLPAENLVQPVELAAKGHRFFPKRPAPATSAADPVQPVLAPRLYPLAGITAAALPAELPPFDGGGKAAAATSPWDFPPGRFLVRLNPDGSVAECVSLGTGNQPGDAVLEMWLRRIQFAPQKATDTRWIALGIGFMNQPANGTDPH